ncbi:MAG: energy-coupling factor ABC transporter ATP-binding protein [Deltaproteobacteria bacterium]|nr:energy-coupling factor ABC transporter ATP-binding protein [Deltaproteobacteria bacterium]
MKSEVSNDESCPNRCDVTPQYINGDGPVLNCRNVSFTYGSLLGNAVKDINFSIYKQDIVVVCGPNGSGKSTLLKLFAGILAPEAGEIVLSSKKLNKKNRRDAFRYMGILFQDPNDQLFCTHVREDIAYGPTNLGLDADEVNRLVETAMEQVEVQHLQNRPIHRLSHGEMKRVGLAGLIAMRPPLILLDEPFAGLDPASTDHLLHLIRHLNGHHRYTFVIVTHNINIASLIAKRLIVLVDGQIIADGPPKDILTDEKLLRASRLEPPILTQLFQRLFKDAFKNDRIPVTIDEALGILNTLDDKSEFCS